MSNKHFELLRSETVPSLNVEIQEYLHPATGARHIHIAADNPENVFLVALRTVPTDSTGVAHILEHTALCGSERYPVRDPFFMMIRRSLNTFMNAFTSSDWTAYPFASQNKKDFDNLLDVYLDAVFFSRLDPLDFAQEGHRVEFETANNPDSDLVFKGVVFNEMKGAMSSAVSTLWQTLSSELFPSNTYHYNSGGEPENIPDLSYDELKAFYKKHYHPSNAIFMTFGNIPASEHQAVFETRVLSRFEKDDTVISVEDEQRFTSKQITEHSYAIDEAEDTANKTHIVVSWLLGHSADPEALLHAHLLSSVLLDNSASPLRHALETSNLGTSPSPLCGLEDSNREMSFMCGIEGGNPENADAVEQLVLDTLKDVAANGVPLEQTEAVLHQLELGQREISGDGFPYGLNLILTALSAAIHRGDPIAALNPDPILENLRQQIKDPDFIKNLVRSQLLDNPHCVRLTMRPDTTLNQQRVQRETERLAKIKAGLSKQEQQDIVDLASKLNERQIQDDDPEILPKVDREDIPASTSIPEGSRNQRGDLSISCFAQGTNGLTYQQTIIALPELDASSIYALSTMGRLMTEVGCGTHDYLETQAWQDRISGGISAYTSMRSDVDNEQSMRAHFILSGKALNRNHGALTELMHDTLLQARFDELPRIRELIAQDRARREQSVTGQGHSLAMMAACSGMSPIAALSNKLRGLEGIKAIKALDDSLSDSLNGEAALSQLASQLHNVHQLLITAPREFLLIGEQEQLESMQDDLSQHWSKDTTSKNKAGFSLPAIRTQIQQMWITNTQVNFCARAFPAVPVEHPDAAALMMLGGFMRNGFLHRAIREQGGAYGGGAGYDSDSASFRFYSYRDPRLIDTLNDFEQSIDWLLSNKHEPRQLEESLLGVIGSLDKPGSPAGEAKDAFHNALYGRTPEQRQHFRERLLAVNTDDLRRVGEQYLKTDNASTAVITNQVTRDEIGDLDLSIHTL